MNGRRKDTYDPIEWSKDIDIRNYDGDTNKRLLRYGLVICKD
jgi:hypothetical protein